MCITFQQKSNALCRTAQRNKCSTRTRTRSVRITWLFRIIYEFALLVRHYTTLVDPFQFTIITEICVQITLRIPSSLSTSVNWPEIGARICIIISSCLVSFIFTRMTIFVGIQILNHIVEHVRQLRCGMDCKHFFFTVNLFVSLCPVSTTEKI